MADKVFDFLISYFSNMNDRGVDKMNNFKGNITSNEVVEWLKKVQNIPVKQPSEDLEKAATALTNEIVGELNVGDYTDHSGHNAHWHSFKDGVVTGAQWQKEQDISKACEWLRYCVDVDDEVKMIDGEPEAKSFIQKNLHRIEVTNQIISDFKKAMEDK